MTRTIEWLRRVPGMTWLAGQVQRMRGRSADANQPFPGSAAYWQARYERGGDSGAGSYGKFAEFKASVLNALFVERGLHSAIEFGCGDGNQLRTLRIDDYLGVDVSSEAIARCRSAFAGVPGRRFMLASDYQGERLDVSLSLDVIYHLVEDATYERYMQQLFGAATQCVVVYSSNQDVEARDGQHVRQRRFTDWVDAHATGWKLLRHVPNAYPYRGDWRTGSFADFYIYVPRESA